MKILSQTSYAEPSETEVKGYPMVVHRHAGSEQTSSALLVLVHGLGGRRYGKSTWGDLPGFLFDDFGVLDLGLYKYETLIERRFWNSIELRDEVNVFADELRDSPYRTIILVGHSMGGLLCQGVLGHWITTNQAEHIDRVHGLVLYATPQTGSQRVPAFLAPLSKDFRTLRPHSRFVAQIQSMLTNSFNLDDRHTVSGKYTVPSWAILASHDFWVDQLSARIGLPHDRCRFVRGSHTSIVKPPSKDVGSYTFLTERVRSILESAAA